MKKRLICDINSGELYLDKFGERYVAFLKIDGWETQQAICLENYRLVSYSLDQQEKLQFEVIGRIGADGKFEEVK
jgi:hypothetical protein